MPKDPSTPRPDPLPDSYWRSTKLLMLWGSREVIPILIRDIERRPPSIILGGDNNGDLMLYPNAQALRKLAHTGTARAILHHLNRYHAEDVSDRAIELYAILLADSVVAEPGEWFGYLEAVVKKAREGSENKANFDRLLIQLEKLKRGERPKF